MNNFEKYIDFDTDWQWKDLDVLAVSSGQLAEFKLLIEIQDARFLIQQLAKLQPPQRIRELYRLQNLQIEWGGSFYETIPDLIANTEDIPVPDSPGAMIETAAFLAKLRNQTRERIEEAGFYPLEFNGKLFESSAAAGKPSLMNLELDISGFQKLLDLLRKGKVTRGEASQTASQPAFMEMIQHRHDLGYIPEPWITRESLINFLLHAASRDPLDMIWKWLNPWNFFDLSDLYMNLDAYDRLVGEIRTNKDLITAQILNRIALFAPPGTVFSDRLSLAVGWGIRGWATESTGGINLEHFKDDFNGLLRTITHETYHRLQLQVCRKDQNHERETPYTFEDLVHSSYPDQEDRKFYEILSYIFLEGSATYVDGTKTGLHAAREGLDLLAQSWDALYEAHDVDQAERLLNAGLKSNGPFYALGNVMTAKIVETDGNEPLGDLLQAGALAFFNRFMQISRKDTSAGTEGILLNPQIEMTIMALSSY